MTRIVPGVLFDIRRPHRLIERSVMVNRRSWMVLFSGFFEPLFYLFSIRIGLGSLVGDLTVNGQVIPYDEFVAPGLLAAAAMNGAIFESTMNVFHKWKATKLYDSQPPT
jgi:lipooligosaccharide transport system permease protein